jgi:hypothetical protein
LERSGQFVAACENPRSCSAALFDTMINPRRSGVDRELDRFLNFSGRAFSDALEREMTEPMPRPKWGGRE